LQDQKDPPESLEEGLLRFFLFIAETNLMKATTFKECGLVKSLPNDRVVVLDPCNAENNVARKITDTRVSTNLSNVVRFLEAVSKGVE
jgi:hypothetical protein